MIGKPCSAPGCSAVIPRGQRYCKAHDRSPRQFYQRKRERTIPYGREWRKQSQAFLASGENAWCKICGDPAQCVDHIIPHGGHVEAFWNQDNWQPLCNRCHSEKTAREDGGFGNKKKVQSDEA